VDQDLVIRAMSGDEAAFEGLVRASADRLAAIAYRILRDVARSEEAVQKTLLTAWRELPRLRDPAKFDAWLHRLLVNTCYAESKTARRWAGEVRVLHLLPTGEGADDETERVADRDQLERGFRRLSIEQRAVLVFHYYQGLTLVEVAEHLGIPLGTVKSRLHSGIASMRSALDADERASGSAGGRSA
jgi:RNA polymerase sigma-70 factor (ECF subfamily)